MRNIAKNGQLAATLAFVYSVAVAVFIASWVGPATLYYLAVQLLVTAVGPIVGGFPSAPARFWLRLTAAILITLWAIQGMTVFGLLFIPAATAAFVSAAQSRPRMKAELPTPTP